MNIGIERPSINAPRIVATTFGVLAGIGGITHGIGEILQGNRAPSGLMFDSWTTGPIASAMDGDPALSLIPNLLVTGILTLILSTIIILWSAAFVQRKNGGHILVALSVVLLLVGGGVGSPVVGLLAGLAGILIHAPLHWWRQRLPEAVRHVLALLWPWTYALALLNGLFLFVAALVLIYTVELNNPALFFNSFLMTVGFLLVNLLTTIAYMIEHGKHEAYERKSNVTGLSSRSAA